MNENVWMNFFEKLSELSIHHSLPIFLTKFIQLFEVKLGFNILFGDLFYINILYLFTFHNKNKEYIIRWKFGVNDYFYL